MNYCALEDAFQSVESVQSPGSMKDNAAQKARREERRKARRCKGPAATYLNVNDVDPDRPSNVKRPDSLNSSTGLREHVPVTQEQFTQDGMPSHNESFMQDDHFAHVNTDKQPVIKNNTRPNHTTNGAPANSPTFDKDPLNDYLIEEQRAKVMTVPTVVESMGLRKKYFGASMDDDVFADYIPDQTNYQLQPDFHTAFEQAGVARAGSAAASARPGLPTPSANNYWKPLTPSGAQTSFMEHLPPPGGKYYKEPQNDSLSTKEIMKKFDKIFARLDDMNTASPEHITSELLMFISSGIFVLFMMDLLVKKGSTMRF